MSQWENPNEPSGEIPVKDNSVTESVNVTDSVGIEMEDTTIPESNEVQIEMQPLMQGEMYDLDERGIGEDIAFNNRKLVAESGEIPKEILAATAAAGTISVTVIVILIIIGLVLGLGIGLGIGAGVGVGVGIGVNACPVAVVKSTSYTGPICYDATTTFKDYTVFGTGFYQQVDRDGKVLTNPTLKLTTGTVEPLTVFPVNQTGIGPALCGQDACLQMNTTGFSSTPLTFNARGYAKSVFSITNKDGCLIETTASVDIHSVRLGATSHSPFCISPNPADPYYSPTVSFTGRGFVFDPSFIFDRPIVQIGGASYQVANVTGTCDQLSATVRVCDTLQVVMTGNSFPAYTDQTATISHIAGKQGCNAAVAIYAVGYATVTSHNSPPLCYATVGDTPDITLTGTGFYAGSKAFLQSGGTKIPATFFGFGTSTSSVVKFSSSVPSGVWTLGIENLGCSTTYPGVELTLLPPVRVFQVSPQAISLAITNSIEIRTSGNTFAPDRVLLIHNGATVKEYIAGTMGSLNHLNITIAKNDLTLPGTYTVQVKNANGCFSILHPGGGNTFVVLATPIALTNVAPAVVAATETTPIVLTGTGFATNPYVYALSAGSFINPIPLTGIVVVGTTTINLNYIQSQLSNGAYDILIVNRDGSSVLSPNALTVQANIRPWIRRISPSNYKRESRVGWLDGDNFLTGATIQVICAGVTYVPTGLTVALRRIDFTFDATTVPEASYCTVTVTNPGSMVSWAFHGLSVHSLRITMGAGNTLSNHFGTTFRVSPAVKMFNTRRGTKHMLTIGGGAHYTGSGTVLNGYGTSIPNSQPDYAVISQWNGVTLSTPVAHNELKNPTVDVQGGSLEVIGEYVYLTGGRISTQVWRAPILDYQATPTITGHSVTFVNTTGQEFMYSGNWWYAVTAKYPGGDAINDGGESLLGNLYNVFIAYPSTPGVNSGFTVTLTFDTVPGATEYRVYRTSGPNGDPNSLQFLSIATAPTFTDTGAVIPTTATNPRYLGKWRPLSTTTVLRGRCGSTVVPSPSDPLVHHFYLGGGGAYTSSIEYLNVTISPKSSLKERELHSTGAWTASAFGLAGDGAGGGDSLQLMTITVAENALPGETWLYHGPGESGAGASRKQIGATRILENGAMTGTPITASIATAVNGQGGNPDDMWGYCFFNWNNGFESWGGYNSAMRTIIEGAQYTSTRPETNPNVNPAGLTTSIPTGSIPTGRVRMGCVQDVGHVFLVGGTSVTTPASLGTEILMVMH